MNLLTILNLLCFRAERKKQNLNGEYFHKYSELLWPFLHVKQIRQYVYLIYCDSPIHTAAKLIF